MPKQRVADLSSILTPNLLRATLHHFVPFPQNGDIDGTAATRFYFGDGQSLPEYLSETRNLCYPALLALSKLGPDAEKVPDLKDFLPHPSDLSFVEQAAGLVLLVDQGPRALCLGSESRWTVGFFDILSLKLSRALLKLPDRLRIDHSERWTCDVGTSYQYWSVIWILLMGPLVHSESLELQHMRVQLGEEIRVTIEKSSGRLDPWRKSKEADMTNTLVFPERVKSWPRGKMQMEDFNFWFMMILDVCIYICPSIFELRSVQR